MVRASTMPPTHSAVMASPRSRACASDRPSAPPLLAHRLAGGDAGFGFPIEHLRRGGRPASFGQLQHFHLQTFLAAGDPDPVARTERLGRLAAGVVDGDLAAVDGLLGETAGLEEARGPEPDVRAHGG